MVGRDKGSLREQQTKGTGTTTIQIRRTENTNSRTQRAALTARCHHMLPSHHSFLPPRPPQQEPSTMAHGTEYPSLARLGQPTWLCPLLASG